GSVCLSVIDERDTRDPLAGGMLKLEYRPGRFLGAMRSRVSAENEQNVIHLSTERGEIVLTQIAGWIARRVLCCKAEGDTLALGERVGMIRFGSRVDIWLPLDADIVVGTGL